MTATSSSTIVILQRDDSPTRLSMRHSDCLTSSLTVSIFLLSSNATAPLYSFGGTGITKIPEGTEKYRKIPENTEKGRKLPADRFQINTGLVPIRYRQKYRHH
jgi:hypothetical protein